MTARRLAGLAALALLVLGDAAVGWLNYHATDDVQPVAALLLVLGFGFAAWRPRLAWVTVPLLWAAVPVSSLIADANNYHPGLAHPAPLYQTLVALLPVVIGAALGIGARRLAQSEQAQD